MNSTDRTTALIFGANGQDGYYLAEVCRRAGIEPVGISRSGDWIHADITSQPDVFRLFQEHRPAYVFHLAANSTSRHDALFENHETISTGSLNVLEAAKRFAPECRVFLSGSGLQFRNTGDPIKETDPFEATNAYAIARIQSVYAARYYRGLGIQTYVGYLYHHESPRRGPNHVSQIIAQTARRISAGSNEVLELGDLRVKKEWTFAGDVAEGMLVLINQEQIFESNIGSGIAYSIQDWLELCFDLVGLHWREHVKNRKGFSAEYPQLVSDAECICSLGWRTRISFEDLAAMMVNM